jgi:hypothetical protein
MDGIRNWLALFGSTGPGLSLGLIYGLILCMLTLGLILLLWGRRLGRVAMGLLLAGLGVLLAPLLAESIHVPLLYVRIGCGVVGMGAGVLLCPFLWVILGAMLASTVAAATILIVDHPKPPTETAEILQAVAGKDICAWAQGLGAFIWNAMQVAAAGREAVFFLLTGGTMMVCTILLVLNLNLTAAVVSALLGAIGITAGGAGLALAVRPELWQGMRQGFYVPAGIVAGLWLFASLYQTLRRGRGIEDQAAENQEESSDSKGEEDRKTKKAKRKSSGKAE